MCTCFGHHYIIGLTSLTLDLINNADILGRTQGSKRGVFVHIPEVYRTLHCMCTCVENVNTIQINTILMEINIFYLKEFMFTVVKSLPVSLLEL